MILFGSEAMFITSSVVIRLDSDYRIRQVSDTGCHVYVLTTFMSPADSYSMAYCAYLLITPAVIGYTPSQDHDYRACSVGIPM